MEIKFKRIWPEKQNLVIEVSTVSVDLRLSNDDHWGQGGATVLSEFLHKNVKRKSKSVCKHPE